MENVRINLNGTIENELLCTALLERAESYTIRLSRQSEKLVGKKEVKKVESYMFELDEKNGKRFDGTEEFEIDTTVAEIINLSIELVNPISDLLSTRVWAYRKGSGKSTKIVVTIDNPVKVEREGEKYKILYNNASPIRVAV